MRRTRVVGAAVAATLSIFPLLYAAEPFGRAEFVDGREPPAFRTLDVTQRARFDLGHALYNTNWVVAGTARADRRDGLGPVFNASSCDACHNNGARGRSAARAGEVPGSLVLQIEGPATAAYGHVLNPSAIPGFEPEARITVIHRVVEGRHADGERWRLREPSYRLAELSQGALESRSVLRPRIAPALFGAGLLESVSRETLERIRRSQSASLRGVIAEGRFGWRGEAASIRQQTERALAREMGIRSMGHPEDDCPPESESCLNAATGGRPEIDAALLDSLVEFQEALAVPLRGKTSGEGERLFERSGCADCHRPSLPAVADGAPRDIDPYTDLLLHDLGTELADFRADGRRVATRFRTPPLWGLRVALERGDAALLHDGRASTVEEAVLWHGGQAKSARRRFTELPAAERRTLLEWVASL